MNLQHACTKGHSEVAIIEGVRVLASGVAFIEVCPCVMIRGHIYEAFMRAGVPLYINVTHGIYMTIYNGSVTIFF